MDALLAGYASSDGSGAEDANDGDRDGDAAQREPPALQGAGEEEERSGAPPQLKRRRHENPPHGGGSERPAAAVKQAIAVTAPRGGPPRPPPALPDPLALLSAASDSERHLVAAAAAALPARPGPPRVRSFPHVAGNFPTVVLLQVPGLDDPLDALYRRLRRLLPDLEPMAAEPDPVDLTAPPGGGAAAASSSGRGRGGGGGSGVVPPHRGYHISLSRCVPVRQHQIAPLAAALSERLRDVARPFRVSLAGLRSFANDEATRSFVSVMVAEGAEQVCGLVRCVDGAFAQHGLPPFYEAPLPHVSVGWLPADQRARIDAALRRWGGAPASAGAGSGRAPAAPLAAGGAAAGGAAAGAAGGGAGCGAEAPPSDAAALLVAANEVVCSWQATCAVAVIGQRQHRVWQPDDA